MTNTKILCYRVVYLRKDSRSTAYLLKLFNFSEIADSTEETESTSLANDTLEQEPISGDKSTEELEPTILQPSDTSGLEAASIDEQQLDTLLSGGLIGEL